MDGGPAPPRVVGIISLGEKEDIEGKLRDLILGQADKIQRTFSDDVSSTISARFEVHKKDGNLTVLTNSTAFKPQYTNETAMDAAVMGALDLCRICDMILFVIDADGEKEDGGFVGMSIGGDDKSISTNKTSSTAQDWDHLISEQGDRILSAVKGQGIPRVATILAKTEAEVEADEDDQMTTQSAKSIRRANLKRRTDLKKYVGRFATTEFGVENSVINKSVLRPRLLVECIKSSISDSY